MPSLQNFYDVKGSGDKWLGIANAVLWDSLDQADRTHLEDFNKAVAGGKYAVINAEDTFRALTRQLHTKRYKLALKTGGSGTVAVGHGMHFEYFLLLKTVFEAATTDLFVVDPYLETKVLTDFCVFAKQSVSIRLLGTKYMATLQPTTYALYQQRGDVMLRKSNAIHDRFVFVDGSKCFLSGASFKDGPKNGPSLLAEITDCRPLLDMYEAIWKTADVLVP